MPELPEVETMCRGIRPIVGARIARVLRPPCDRRPIAVVPGIEAIERRSVGRRVADIRRLGKRVLIVTDDAYHLVFEPRMTGLVLLSDPPDDRALRIEIRFEPWEGPERLWFWDRRGLGTFSGLETDELERRWGGETVGPDALSIEPADFRGRLAPSRRPIKVALLDQTRVAGIGNLYASEMLHVARIHPETPCDRLTGPQWERLFRAMRDVLETAIRYEGSTLADGTYRNALNKAGGYQNHHRVYDRADERCPDCERGIVVRIVQAQRSTFFCPRCQRPARS